MAFPAMSPYFSAGGQSSVRKGEAGNPSLLKRLQPVGLSAQGGWARFTVRDTGIGLAPEDLAHVFDRFYRVDKSRSRAGGGSGIGLTISRHIVALHGGTIDVASDGLGQGSTFSFTIPLA